MATDCEFAISLGSTRQDLKECCQLASQGLLRIDAQRFRFDEFQEACDLFREGKLQGRAVIVMD